MEHHFNIAIACKYGVLEAILINNFEYWIKKNIFRKRGIRMTKMLRSITRIGALYIVIHDVYMTTIYSWTTNQFIGFTWIGLITFMIALFYTINEFQKCCD
jgi:1,4-dihydroxy-2-naphthoate octaprenyltransferase